VAERPTRRRLRNPKVCRESSLEMEELDFFFSFFFSFTFNIYIRQGAGGGGHSQGPLHSSPQPRSAAPPQSPYFWKPHTQHLNHLQEDFFTTAFKGTKHKLKQHTHTHISLLSNLCSVSFYSSFLSSLCWNVQGTSCQQYKEEKCPSESSRQ